MPKLKSFGSPGKNLESFFHDRPELLSSGDWSSPCEIAVKRKKLLPLNDLTLLVLGQVLEKHSLLLWTKTTFVKIVATNPNKQPLMLKKKRGHDFFLSSCRARSRLRRSSKRFVFDWQFPHVGEWVRAKKTRCLQNKANTKTAKQHPTKTEPKQPKKTPRKLRETLRFQKSPQAAQYCFAML